MNQVKFLSFVIGLIVTSGSFANGEGFLSGNRFSAVLIHGEVNVTCPNGATVAYACRETSLDPSTYDYFVGPQGVVADEVLLSNLRPDGSRRDRASAYSRVSGRSVDAFNLWISTIFQRPLLQLGANKIDFMMRKNSQNVSQGSFNVSVESGPARECPATSYNSTDPTDCESQYTVCQRYFEQYQYCR